MPAKDGTAERLLTIRQLAELWGVCERTIHRRISSGDLPVVRLSSHAVRVRESVAARYLTSREQAAA